MHVTKQGSQGSTLVLKPRGYIPISPKPGYQWPDKKADVLNLLTDGKMGKTTQPFRFHKIEQKNRVNEESDRKRRTISDVSYMAPTSSLQTSET